MKIWYLVDDICANENASINLIDCLANRCLTFLDGVKLRDFTRSVSRKAFHFWFRYQSIFCRQPTIFLEHFFLKNPFIWKESMNPDCVRTLQARGICSRETFVHFFACSSKLTKTTWSITKDVHHSQITFVISSQLWISTRRTSKTARSTLTLPWETMIFAIR